MERANVGYLTIPSMQRVKGKTFHHFLLQTRKKYRNTKKFLSFSCKLSNMQILPEKNTEI